MSRGRVRQSSVKNLLASVKSNFAGKADIILIVAASIMVGYGFYIRVLPAFSNGFVVDDVYSLRALAGLALPGDPSFILKPLAQLLGVKGIALAPVVAWLIGIIMVSYTAVKLSGYSPAAAILLAVSGISISSAVVQASLASRFSWDTMSIVLVPLVALLLIEAYRRESPILASIAGVAIGLSALAWGGYFILIIMVVAAFVVSASSGFKVKVSAYLMSSTAAALIVSKLAVGGLTQIIQGESLIITVLALASIAAARGIIKGWEVAWASLSVSSLYIIEVMLGIVESPALVKSLLAGGVIEAIESAPAPVPAGDIIRDFGFWILMSFLGALIIVYNARGRGKVDDHTVVSIALMAGLISALIIGVAATAWTITSAAVLSSMSAPLILRGLRSLGLTFKGDELAMVIVIGMFLSFTIVIGYLGYTAYQNIQLLVPFTLGGQAILSAGQDPEPVNIWAEVARVIEEEGAERVYIWPLYGYIIEGMTGIDATTIDDGEDRIYITARILTGSEGEATYILREVEGLSPGEALIVVREVFIGSYDSQTGLVLLYPRPVLVQALTNTSFVIQGVADFSHLLTLLEIAGRLEPGEGPFTSSWYSESGLQGFFTRMFPGLLGNPPENVSNVRNALLVKTMLDAVFKLSTDGMIVGVCDFIPETATFVPGVFLQSPGGGSVQPLFIITDMERFQPVKVIMGCPQIISDTGVRIEFTAEVVAIYRWTG